MVLVIVIIITIIIVIRERLAGSKVWAEKERVYTGNGRTETENNCKNH